jgi:hypothetical protein
MVAWPLTLQNQQLFSTSCFAALLTLKTCPINAITLKQKLKSRKVVHCTQVCRCSNQGRSSVIEGRVVIDAFQNSVQGRLAAACGA